MTYFNYTILPKDSVANIAKRWEVPLRDLVDLNPQVCTSGPQMGLIIKIPVKQERIIPINKNGSIIGYMVKDKNGKVFKTDKIITEE
jgi:hypothetical protein